MEETKNTSAVILDRRPYRESDTLVTVYTKEFGKQVLIARGTKKLQSKLAGHLEPISRADIMIVRGKNFDYIGAALGRDAYPDLKADLNKLYFAGRAIACFNRLVKENQADERLFFLLVEWLERLDNPVGGAPREEKDKFDKADGERLLSFFTLKLLTELGYQPALRDCLVCRQPLKPGRNYFDLKNGGVIGAECRPERKERPDYPPDQLLVISDDSLKIIRYVIANSFGQAQKLKIDRKTIKELNNIISQFILYVN